jgi:hypothetical protein
MSIGTSARTRRLKSLCLFGAGLKRRLVDEACAGLWLMGAIDLRAARRLPVEPTSRGPGFRVAVRLGARFP